MKRAYFIFDTTPGTVRGHHAHKSLRQVLICVSGACTIDCEMPDGTTSSHRLDWPTKGLLVLPPGGLPVTERINAQELSLPIGPTIRDEEVVQVIDAVNSFAGGAGKG